MHRIVGLGSNALECLIIRQLIAIFYERKSTGQWLVDYSLIENSGLYSNSMAWGKAMLSDKFEIKSILFSKVPELFLLAFKFNKETLLGHMYFCGDEHKLVTTQMASLIYWYLEI